MVGDLGYHQHRERFIAGVRAAVEWLHKRADEMSDPHARAILNSSAFNLGTDLAHRPQVLQKDCELSADRLEALRLIDRHGDLQRHSARDMAIPEIYSWLHQHDCIKRIKNKFVLTEAGRETLARQSLAQGGDDHGR